MMARNNQINYLPSPVRRASTQEFDYEELIADKKFHAVVDDHRRHGAFEGLQDGTKAYNAKLKEIAVAFVRVSNEKRATLFRNRGISYGRSDAFREALSCYNRALELSLHSPSRHVTLANRAAAYIKMHKYAEALDDAQEASTLCAEYAIAHSLIGYCQSRFGLLKEAIVSYHVALRLNPTDVSSQELLADAKRKLLASGESAEVIDDLEAPFLTCDKPVEKVSPANVENEAGRDDIRHTISPERERRSWSPPLTKSKSPVEGVGRGQAGQAPDTVASDKKTPEKRRLTRKLSSGSAQAFASLTQLPNKLKNAITTKARGRSGLPKHGCRRAGERSNDYLSVVEDTAGAAAPPSAGPAAPLLLDPPERSRSGNLENPPPKPTTKSSDFEGQQDVADGPDTEQMRKHLTVGDSMPPQREQTRSRVHTREHEQESGGRVASPDTIGYDEDLLGECRAFETPLCKAASGECPGAPMRPGYAAQMEVQALRKSGHHRVAVPTISMQVTTAETLPPKSAIFVPPPREQGQIPQCPPAPRLGPSNGRKTITQSPSRVKEDAVTRSPNFLLQDCRTQHVQHPIVGQGCHGEVGARATRSRDPSFDQGDLPSAFWATRSSPGPLQCKCPCSHPPPPHTSTGVPLTSADALELGTTSAVGSNRSPWPAPTAATGPENAGWTSSDSAENGNIRGLSPKADPAITTTAAAAAVTTAIAAGSKTCDHTAAALSASARVQQDSESDGGEEYGTRPMAPQRKVTVDSGGGEEQPCALLAQGEGREEGNDAEEEEISVSNRNGFGEKEPLQAGTSRTSRTASQSFDRTTSLSQEQQPSSAQQPPSAICREVGDNVQQNPSTIPLAGVHEYHSRNEQLELFTR